MLLDDIKARLPDGMRSASLLYLSLQDVKHESDMLSDQLQTFADAIGDIDDGINEDRYDTEEDYKAALKDADIQRVLYDDREERWVLAVARVIAQSPVRDLLSRISQRVAHLRAGEGD